MSDYISGDNLALILKWLPVKILLRFRSVCKSWKEIIDSPFFHHEHLSARKPRFLIQNEGSPEFYVVDPYAFPSVVELNDLQEYREFSFLASHHGVVCLYDDHDKNFSLWNPSIRKLMTVSIPDYFDCGWEYVHEESCFGFWIDLSSKEFKFVLLDYINGEEGEIMEVEAVLYSSVLQEWRFIPAAEVENWTPHPPVMIQGVAHWRANKSADNAHVILSFDFVRESFDVIDMPDVMKFMKHSYIEPMHFHWQGTLSLVVNDQRSRSHYNIYLRQEGLWVNMYEFDLQHPITNVLWVLGEEERFRLLAEADSELVLYDTRAGIIPLCEEGFDDSFIFIDEYDPIDAVLFPGASVSYDFVESLIFPEVNSS